MSRIKITDLKENQEISEGDMRMIRGGRNELNESAVNNMYIQNPGTLVGTVPLPFPHTIVQNPGDLAGIAPLPFPRV